MITLHSRLVHIYRFSYAAYSLSNDVIKPKRFAAKKVQELSFSSHFSEEVMCYYLCFKLLQSTGHAQAQIVTGILSVWISLMFKES